MYIDTIVENIHPFTLIPKIDAIILIINTKTLTVSSLKQVFNTVTTMKIIQIFFITFQLITLLLFLVLGSYIIIIIRF